MQQSRMIGGRCWIAGIGAIVLLLTGTAGWSATGQVAHDMPTKPSTFGRYLETVEDMRVKVLGGHLRVTREWAGKDWQINRRWSSVGYHWEHATNCHTAYTDNNGVFHPASCSSGSTFMGFTRDNIKYSVRKLHETNADGSTTSHWYSSVEPGKYFVMTTDPTATPITNGAGVTPAIASLRWQDVKGEWIEYQATGQAGAPLRPSRFGNRNDVSVTLNYNTDGKLIGLSDHLGKQILWYEYDTTGNLSLIKDYSGRQVEYRYNAKKQLIEITDVRGYIWKYDYTPQGYIASKTDPNNHTTTFTTTAGGVLVDKTDPLGNKTLYKHEYDKTKKEYYKRETTPGGKVTELWYDDKGEFLRKSINSALVKKIERKGMERIETGEDGNKTIRIVNSDELTTKTTWADGSFTTTEYATGTSYPTKEVDENGVITLYEYDAKWNLKKLTEASGKPEQRITTYTYDSNGNRLSTTIEADAVSAKVTTSATYDEYGNAKTRKDGVGNVTSYTYDAMGNVLTETKPGNRTWTYTYDSAGNLLTKTDPLKYVTAYEYDKVSNRVKVTDAMKHVTQYQFDAIGQMTEVINALNQSTRLVFNPDGHLIKIIESSGAVKRMEYDSRGRLIKKIDAAGNTILRAYVTSGHGAGKVSGIQYPTYSELYSYDNRGNLIGKATHLSASETQSESYVYDGIGNRVNSTDAKGRTTKASYDGLGRLVELANKLGDVTKYAYDNRNNRISITNAKGIVSRRYSYDENNRKLSVAWPDGHKMWYRYDDVSNTITHINAMGQVARYQKEVNDIGLKKVEYFAKESDAVPTRIETYALNRRGQPTIITDGMITLTRTYTSLNQLESETVNYGSFSLGYQYGFDAAGRKTSLTRPDSKTVDYTYNNADQLTGITLPGAGTLTWNGYQWNAPTSMTLPGGSTMQWAYDALMRPSAIAGKDAGDNPLLNYSYTYDEVGNITEKKTEHGDYAYGYDTLDRLTSASNPTLDDEAYIYDAVGNRLTDNKAVGDWVYGDDDSLTSRPGVTYKYDANGSMIEKDDNGTITRYVYDVTGRMTEVRDGNDTLIASYAYDPFGRRIKKTVNGMTTYFLYSEEGLIAEADSAGNVSQQYGWKPGGTWGTDPLYLIDGNDTYYYENDHLGTPQKLIGGSGTVVWSVQYESFGFAQSNISMVTNSLRFPGQYYDSETSMYYNFFRMYEPTIGRYTKVDPVELGRGFNTYTYVLNNPIRLFDPIGKEPWCWTLPDGMGTYCDDTFDYDGYKGKSENLCCDEGVVLCHQSAMSTSCAACLASDGVDVRDCLWCILDEGMAIDCYLEHCGPYKCTEKQSCNSSGDASDA